MNKGLKWVLPFAIILVGVAGVIAYHNNSGRKVNNEVVPIAPTGKLTDAAAALNQTAAAEDSLLSITDAQVSSVSENTIAAAGVPGAYAETNFNTCQDLAKIASNGTKAFSHRRADFISTQSQISSQLDTKFTDQDAQVKTERQLFDNNLDLHFAKLKQRATTTDQVRAVEQFKLSVTAALIAKRSADDSALASFRTGLRQILATRRNTLNLELKTFQASISAAIDQASTDCQNGVSDSTVRLDLRTAIINAKTDFTQDRALSQEISPAIDQLVSSRRQAVASARADFTLAISTATAKLKDALGVRAS